MGSKGLGSGLGALFGDSAFEPEQEKTDMVPISKIEPRADQPRSIFDENQLFELSQSIKEHGLIQPITVRSIDGGYYQIIAGERRWRASRMAGLDQVPVRIIEADDKMAMVLAMVENLQREDLNPVEEARGYRTLMETYGFTQASLSEAVGKSRPVVANALRILTLPEEVLKLAEEGQLSLSQARAVLEAEGDENRIFLGKKAAQEGLTVRQITAAAAKLGKVPKIKDARPVGDDGVDYYAEVEKSLSGALGRRVKIQYGRKRGKIEIEYYGDEDFEAICEILRDAGKTENK